MEYTLDYFIEKFRAIPEDKIGAGHLKNCCALYHCGVTTNQSGMYVKTAEAEALMKILGDEHDMGVVYRLNDNLNNDYKKFGDTPKKRIVNKLTQIKQSKS